MIRNPAGITAAAPCRQRHHSNIRWSIRAVLSNTVWRWMGGVGWAGLEWEGLEGRF